MIKTTEPEATSQKIMYRPCSGTELINASGRVKPSRNEEWM